MSEYVPTLDDMIECVCGEGAVGYERAEFDRFLASVKAQALRDAASRLAEIDTRSDAVFWDGGGYERVTYWLKVLANQIERAAAPTVSTEPEADAITEAQWRDLLAAGAERGLSPAEVGNLAAHTVGRQLPGWQAITTDDLDGITAAIDAYSKEN